MLSRGRLCCLIVVLALGGSSLTACSEAAPDSAGDAEAGASVSFVGLEDGAELSAPAEICLEVTGLTIEPSGDVHEGAGHHHVIVDPSEEERSGYSDGTIREPLPKDETHIHMGDGSSCTTVDLSPGMHELMAVVGDGEHIPLDPPVVATVSVMVGE